MSDLSREQLDTLAMLLAEHRKSVERELQGIVQMIDEHQQKIDGLREQERTFTGTLQALHLEISRYREALQALSDPLEEPEPEYLDAPRDMQTSPRFKKLRDM